MFLFTEQDTEQVYFVCGKDFVSSVPGEQLVKSVFCE